VKHVPCVKRNSKKAEVMRGSAWTISTNLWICETIGDAELLKIKIHAT
jgi:hypothetical protein